MTRRRRRINVYITRFFQTTTLNMEIKLVIFYYFVVEVVNSSSEFYINEFTGIK